MGKDSRSSFITGTRRCGKSYLLLKLSHRHLLESVVDEGRIVEVALDDRANKALRDPDASLAYLRPRIVGDGLPTYVILGEAQMVDESEDVPASAVGSLTNPSRIQNTFRSVRGKRHDDKTISSYVGYLESAYLVAEAQRCDIKGRSHIGSPKKYYFEDVGLRNARLGFRQVEESHLMENVIYSELLSRGYNVDFVATLGSSRCYVQSALSMGDPAKREQETRPLLGIPDSFRKIVVVRGRWGPGETTMA